MVTTTTRSRTLLLSLVLATVPALAATEDVFEGREGCFILQEGGATRPLERVGTLCAERVSPCSTFKIPNSLIGLETGVLADENAVLPWDGVKRSRPEWNRDHTLASAIKVSVVWYYQELARRVGTERMQKLVLGDPLRQRRHLGRHRHLLARPLDQDLARRAGRVPRAAAPLAAALLREVAADRPGHPAAGEPRPDRVPRQDGLVRLRRGEGPRLVGGLGREGRPGDRLRHARPRRRRVRTGGPSADGDPAQEARAARPVAVRPERPAPAAPGYGVTTTEYVLHWSLCRASPSASMSCRQLRAFDVPTPYTWSARQCAPVSPPRSNVPSPSKSMR